MTIIESFEKAPIENIISILDVKPQKVIFLGDMAQMKRAVSVYEKLLDENDISTEIELQGIRKHDLENVLETIEKIVEKEEQIVFDITGGEELILLAFGMIYERYREKKNLNLKRVNVEKAQVSLDVKELISLYGGIVVPEEPQPMVENALEIVDKVWELARYNGPKWNREHSYLKELERKGDRSEDILEVQADFCEVKKEIGDYSKKYREVVGMLERLRKAGLIKELCITEDAFSYTYENAFVRRCLVNAGDALEMKSYCEALDLKEKGKPFFNNCYVGVTIDWDGVIHPKEENWQDTTNEIDLILMKGLVPVFISCKNGKIGEEELYKLNTVAKRFGGKYAKKMLIATKLEKDSPVAKKAYMQRAKDMGITLIPNAGELSKEEWKKLFEKI